MGGCTARLFAQNFDAVLVVIVILAGEAIFVIFELEVYKTPKTTCFMILDMLDFPGCAFSKKLPLHSEGPGPGPGPHWARVPNGPGGPTYGPTLGLGGGGGMSHTGVGVYH